MRLCIPSQAKGGLDDQVGYHFGRVPSYTIFDDSNNEVEIIENSSTHRGGTELPARLLREYNVDIMICGGIGHRAIQLFEQFGIEIYVGAQGTVKEAIEQYNTHKLKIATDKEACQQHKYQGEGTGHGNEHHN
ncbi:NifB/NifX family molybdenum-iron cluster-binding protein [Candidatus Hodarchaeum mangrovi]